MAKNTALIREIVSKLTYKKDWEFSVSVRQFATIVACKFDTYSVDDPTKKIVLMTTIAIPDWAEKLHIIDIIYTAIADIEMHELAEWLKIDGKHIREPHPLPKVDYVCD